MAGGARLLAVAELVALHLQVVFDEVRRFQHEVVVDRDRHDEYFPRLATLVALLAVSCLVLLQGCTSPEEAAAGTYVLDKENIKAAARAEMEKEQDPMNKAAMEMTMGMIDNMSMTVSGEPKETVTGTLKGDILELHPPKDSDMPFKLVFRKQK